MWDPLLSAPGKANLFKNIGFEQLNRTIIFLYYLYIYNVIID